MIHLELVVSIIVMKVCTKCGQAKSETEYFVKDKKTKRLHAQCKACCKERRASYYAAHYGKYGDLYRVRAKKRRVLVKKRLQSKMLIYLEDKSCWQCGEGDPRVLDFDHINPATKSFGISNGITDGRKWSSILTEISKCVILCANCHRKRTAAQQGWYRNII